MPKLGAMLIDLGVIQYVPNQGKECKLPAYYGCTEVSHFEGLSKESQRYWIGSSSKKKTGLPGVFCNGDLGSVE